MSEAQQLAVIGASDLAVTVGLQRRHRDGTPWQSALELWARLRGLLPRYDSGTNPDAEAGICMEPGIGYSYAERYGLTFGVERDTGDIYPGPKIPAVGLWHAELPWLRVRPDFYVPARRRVLQAKAPRVIDDEWGAEGTGDVPVWVAVQELAELAIVYRVFGWTTADVAVQARAANRNDRSRALFTIERDERVEARLLQRAFDWYKRHVEDGEPPLPDGSESAGHTLVRLFKPRDVQLEASESDVKRWSHLLQLRSTLNELDARVKQEEQELQQRMAEATALVYNGQRLATWRKQKGRSLIDLTRLRRERPDIAAEFAMTTEETRKFNLEGT